MQQVMTESGRALRLCRSGKDACLVLGGLLATGSIVQPQACWTKTDISSTADGATAIFAADVDGDGDQDVLSASQDDDKIAWYENTGSGRPPFVEHVISISANLALDVFAADMDGDGDVDALSASSNKIAWHENTIGNGSFWVEHVIVPNALNARGVFAADVDSDGDLDAISAACDSSGNEIAWYENGGGEGPVWTSHTIPSSTNCAYGLFASDIDGDGDTDILARVNANPFGGAELVWHENTAGDGSLWSEHLIQFFDGFFYSVSTADVDGDGDLDCLTSFSILGPATGISWFENATGDGSIWNLHQISSRIAESHFSADVDGDGDTDVLTGLFPFLGPYELAWHENVSGDGGLWIEHSIANNASCFVAVLATDMDGDGDLDPLSASNADDEVAWYDNAPFASVTYRNAGFNPISYAAIPPLLGRTFTATVNLAGTTGHYSAGLIGYQAPLNLTLGIGQVLLVDVTHPTGELLAQPPQPGPVAVFTIQIPNDPALCGEVLYTQAIHFGGLSPFTLSNAQDLVIGYP